MSQREKFASWSSGQLIQWSRKHHHGGPREKWTFVQVEIQGELKVGLQLFIWKII